MTLPFLTHDLLRGALVQLRAPLPDDLPHFVTWANDMEYSRLLRRGWITPATLEGFQSWFSSMSRSDDSVPFSIVTRADARLIGLLVIKDIVWQARHCSFFIALGQPEDRGRGYGTDALRVLLRYCFQEMNMNAVRLEVMAYNPAAYHTYQRIGFTHDGTLRACVFRDGVYYDVHCLSILRSEWTDVLPSA